MRFEEHCDESVILFGERFEEVHKWLDEFAGKPGIGMQHRKFRHHKKGIEEVAKKWGADAAEAAEQHIISDLMQDQWMLGVHELPKDMEDYVKMGLF